MLYKDFLKKKRSCPFCQLSNQVVIENKKSFLTYAAAPYSRDHLLVIPKRHVVNYLALVNDEREDIDVLLKQGAKILKKLGYHNYSILVRDGNNKQKTVKHLHYHLIPNHRIGDLDSAGQPRVVLTKGEESLVVQRLKKASKSLVLKK